MPRRRVAAGSAVGRRRLIFAVLCALTWVGIVWLAVASVATGAWSGLVVAILVLLALQIPWLIVGFWNAAIGFLIMRFVRDPAGLCCPPSSAAAGSGPLASSTAILMCIRNEDPDTVFARLDALLVDLDRTGEAGAFDLYVLSDTNDAATAAREAQRMAVLEQRWLGKLRGLTYRRRLANPGFKAGNIRDFCERWGDGHDFALVLDADSFMSGAKIVEIVRILEATPDLGLVQCLTVGMPSLSPLARLFQFGMRLGMRSYTLGSAWWQADCGPYWGHNALIRLQPFIAHCHLPPLPGRPPFGGDILSHDQVEAVLMRRAGYEVRVIPVEGGSYEENPPTLIEFVRRDLRWCVGNLQYLALLGLPGIELASRVQLALAIWMFLASIFNVGLWSLVLVQSLIRGGGDWLAPGPAIGLVWVLAVMMLAPKLATALAVLTDATERRAYGGGLRFLQGFLIEVVFSFLITPILALSQAAAIIAFGFGHTIGWQAQVRSQHGIAFGEALRRFWPHTLFGLAVMAGLAAISTATAVWSAPVYIGLVLAVPLTMITSAVSVGRGMNGWHLCAIPEEITPPSELAGLDLPALRR